MSRDLGQLQHSYPMPLPSYNTSAHIALLEAVAQEFPPSQESLNQILSLVVFHMDAGLL